MRLRLAAFLLILPFFLQLLGFGKTPLGGGLCGELFLVQNPALAFQTPGFWYALLFMVLLALELGYGLSLLLLPLLEVPVGPGWRRLGRYLVGVMGGGFSSSPAPRVYPPRGPGGGCWSGPRWTPFPCSWWAFPWQGASS